MKRFMFICLIAVPGMVGCGPAKPTTPKEYQHSLKAAAPDDRLKAIEERQTKYGGAQK